MVANAAGVHVQNGHLWLEGIVLASDTVRADSDDIDIRCEQRRTCQQGILKTPRISSEENRHAEDHH
jgi:hypothetical protein